jgi:5-methylcytosine-specific restriction enzyme subunit McrC
MRPILRGSQRADPVLTVFEHAEVPVEVVAGASCLSDLEADAALRIASGRRGFCSRGHRSIRFAQHAGLVSLAGRVLEVLPKVEQEKRSTSSCRGVFLRLLHLAENLHLSQFESVGQTTKGGNLLEVFVHAFFDELLTLIRGGLLRRYREEEDDLSLVRGRILWSRQIGSLAMRYDRIACRYDDLKADNEFNRVIKAALHLLRRQLRSASLVRRWTELWPAFEDVSLPPDPLASLKALTLDSQTRRYSAALRWASWILRALSPDLRGGRGEAPGLLFDTNQLFERAVARHLRQSISRASDCELELSTQESGNYLGLLEVTQPSPVVALRPDLILRLGEDVALVADTKWKRIEVARSGHLDPATGDVYQLLAYAAAFQCADVALIYPWHAGLELAKATVIRLPDQSGRTVRLHVLAIDVGENGLPARIGGNAPHLGRLFASAAA